MPQFDLTNFNRFILDTENDADSPDNEELMQQYMYNIVGLLILMLDTGISGSATADPTNVANSVFTDAAAVWTDDLHNGRTLLMTSGTCKGLFYKINDTDDAGNTLTINDNLFTEGVRNGDNYKILYDLIDNLDGHDHDGMNSKTAVLADAVISQAKLKTSTHEQTLFDTAVWTEKVMTFADYGFNCRVKDSAQSGNNQFKRSDDTNPTAINSAAYKGESVWLKTETVCTAYVIYRYVAASGEVFWLWILRDKITKKIISIDASSDHCSFGRKDPSERPHPFQHEYDPEKHEIILINPTEEGLKEMYAKKTDSLIDVFLNDYEIDEGSKPQWPIKAVTTKILNDDWFECFITGKKVEVEKKVIPKVDYILCKKLKKKKGLI